MALSPPPASSLCTERLVLLWRFHVQVGSSCSFCAWLLSLSRRSSVHICVWQVVEYPLFYREKDLPVSVYHTVCIHTSSVETPAVAAVSTASVYVDCRFLYSTDFLSFACSYPGTFLLSTPILQVYSSTGHGRGFSFLHSLTHISFFF